MNLKTWRKTTGLSQSEVAGMLGVSTWTLSRYENKQHAALPRELMGRIIVMTNGKVRPDDLFGIEEIAMLLERKEGGSNAA